MIVINTTRRTLIGEDVYFAKTLAEKTNGLLGKDKSSSIFLKTRWGIHTVGMKFPIDCLVLDGRLEVKALRENLKPGRFFFWWPGYKNVLELPARTVLNTRTQIGDILEMRL